MSGLSDVTHELSRQDVCHTESLRYNIRLTATRQLGLFPLLAVALGLTLLLALFAALHGQGYSSEHRALGATLAAFAGFLGVMLGFAASGAPEKFASLLGPGAAWLLALSLFLFFLIYALGTGTASLVRVLVAAGFFFAPLLLLASGQGTAPGSWQDFLTLCVIWVAVKFGPSHWMWPYPGERLSYIFTVIAAVDVAIAGFLVLRGIKNVGYNIAWANRWALYVLGSLAVFACIAIPLGIRIHFIAYAPRLHEWKAFLPLSVGILFFTAWPEELLFRGLLQNLLSRAGKSDTGGWIAASVLFGFSHITNLHFPNWRYVFLATIAGLFYGWTWRKTGSIFASALVHSGVDILWHFFFRTV